MKILVLILALLLTFGCGGEHGEKTQPTAEAPSQPPQSTPSEEKWDFNKDESGHALGGYDAVAYHQDGVAKPGVDGFKHAWGDAVWLFASSQNRDAFAADPKAFAPFNGGYCTFGIVLKKKLDGNPKVWHMEENRLHFFLNPEVKEKFMLDQSGNMKSVTENWPGMKGLDL